MPSGPKSGEGNGQPDAQLLPHERFAKNEGGTISALKALVLWADDGRLLGRDESEEILGKQSEAVRRGINDLKHALEIPRDLMVMKGRKYELTDLGKQLADSARRVLAVFDDAFFELESTITLTPNVDLPHIDVGCFNAAVKHFLAQMFGALVSDAEFPYRIRVNRDMNLRTVSPRSLINGLGDRFHYVVVPWAHESALGRLPHLQHEKLYRWKLVVVFPDDHPLRAADHVTVEEVLATCRDRQRPLPLLLSPSYNVSRTLVDNLFAEAASSPELAGIVENPDTYTRYELARHGQGISIANSDGMPALSNDQPAYPALVDMAMTPAGGIYTLTWRGRSSPPLGVPRHMHEIFVRVLLSSVQGFVSERPRFLSLP